MRMSINTKDNNEDNLHGLEDLDDTRETAPIESKPITYQVRKCCDEMPHHMYVLKDNRIDIEGDDFEFEDVKYCMYCGNRLRPEVAPLSPKDKALEELKTEMEK